MDGEWTHQDSLVRDFQGWVHGVSAEVAFLGRLKNGHCCCHLVTSVLSDSFQLHGLYVAHQAPLLLGFSRQEYWSGLPFPSLGDLPDPGTELGSPVVQAFFTTEQPAAAKSLQSCPTLCDPIDGSHQAPPSLGLSRQEHWSGLPFPSPMCESEK